MPSAAKATKRYEQRMKQKGFVRKHLWVPAHKASELEDFAESLRRESGTWTEEEFVAVRKKLISQLKITEWGLKEFANVRHITIFGSYARGDATPESDVDIYVELEPYADRGLRYVSALQEGLEDAVGRKVDLVMDEIKNHLLRKKIDQDGIRIF